MVERSGFKPDLVVGIANGGVHPAFFAAQALGAPLLVYRAQRRTSRLKQRLSFARKALQWKLLRRPIYRLNSMMDRWLTGVASADKLLDVDVRDKRILLIDDCVDSGATMAHVRAALRQRGAAEIKLAALCWTTKYDSVTLHGLAPDHYLSRVLHSYPWSADNPEFEAFSDWARDHCGTASVPGRSEKESAPLSAG